MAPCEGKIQSSFRSKFIPYEDLLIDEDGVIFLIARVVIRRSSPLCSSLRRGSIS